METRYSEINYTSFDLKFKMTSQSNCVTIIIDGVLVLIGI